LSSQNFTFQVKIRV